jgi:hypothetical protein
MKYKKESVGIRKQFEKRKKLDKICLKHVGISKHRKQLEKGKKLDKICFKHVGIRNIENSLKKRNKLNKICLKQGSKRSFIENNNESFVFAKWEKMTFL